MVRIKVCGITNLRDALLAVSAGVDAIGFVFAKSPRRITPKRAKKIIEALPPFIPHPVPQSGTGGILSHGRKTKKKSTAGVIPWGSITKVGVFVDEKPEIVKKIIKQCSLDTIQFHGNETPAYCRSFKGIKVIKAFRMKDGSVIKKMKRYKVDALLLDAYNPKLKGGTGKTFNWALAKKAKKYGVPIILSGGLNPANIKDAILKVKPYAVDVSSGVEKSPGKKSPQLIRSFISRSKKACR
ncbi:MAG: phosphoribosylanthranilate isomerase [Candidatus Omnitrophota bacterium]